MAQVSFSADADAAAAKKLQLTYDGEGGNSMPVRGHWQPAQQRGTASVLCWSALRAQHSGSLPVNGSHD